MTCQHCQTWILDDDHRCRRCGRRVRSTPGRISPSTYPIAAAATAPAYDFAVEQEIEAPQEPAESGQQSLFSQFVNEPRVIPFDSLTSAVERESIRARAADLARPAPLRTAKVEVRRPANSKRHRIDGQQSLDFLEHNQVAARPESSVICDAPVAPAALRIQAAMIDGAIIAAGWGVCLAIFLYVGGRIPLDRHLAPFLLLMLSTVPLVYKLLWTFAGRDSIGMQETRLRLVDFDGNPPSRTRRYHRLAGSIISLLAAGMGLIWVFVDEDALTWHDHISGTFPAIAEE